MASYPDKLVTYKSLIFHKGLRVRKMLYGLKLNIPYTFWVTINLKITIEVMAKGCLINNDVVSWYAAVLVNGISTLIDISLFVPILMPVWLIL
jgi:hypothetical protein